MNGLKKVAPLTGAWIEIVNDRVPKMGTAVAPLTGAWIEIKAAIESAVSPGPSHP